MKCWDFYSRTLILKGNICIQKMTVILKVKVHQAQTVNPLPNVNGPLPNVRGVNNVCRGRSVHCEISRRVSVAWTKREIFSALDMYICLLTAPLRNRGDSIVMETLSNANGYVRRGRSIHRTVRRQGGESQ